MKKLMGSKRIAALLLALCLMLSALTVPAAATDSQPGYFYLSVVTNQKTVIAPTRVTYTAGQSVLDAIESSGFDFKFQGGDKVSVETIEGVSANFVRFHDYTIGDNDYDLTVPAEKINVLAFTETMGQNSASVTALILGLGKFAEMTNNVQSYGPAAEAYDAALTGLRTTSAEEADALLAGLNAAVKEYEALLAGTKYTVTFAPTQNGASPAKSHIRMTDSYGNVTEADGASISVIAGKYSFEVTDGGCNSVRGTLTAGEGSPAGAVAVTLPHGQWFDAVRLSRNSGSPAFDKEIYRSVYAGTNEGTFYVPDCTTLLYLNAQMGDVPDEKNTKLCTVYAYTDTGKDASETTRSWDSTYTSMVQCIGFGMDGITVPLEGRYTGADGYMQVQTYTMHIVRIPTLKSVTVKAPDGTPQIVEPVFDPYTNEYTLTAVTDSILLAAEGYGESYTVSGTGKVQTAAGTDAEISVSANGQTTKYTLHITRRTAANVKLTVPDGCTAEVRDAAGNAIPASADGSYALIPGGSYTCVTTKDVWYHASAVFTASDGLTVKAASPITADAITAAALFDNLSSSTRNEFKPETPFAAGTHSVRYVIADTISRMYAQATATSGYTVTAIHDNVENSTGLVNGIKETPVTAAVGGSSSATRLNNLIQTGGTARTLTLRASKTSGGTTYYQDYTLFLVRSLHLKSLTVAADGETLSFTDADSTRITFNGNVTDYYMQVANTTASATVTAQYAASGGYAADIGGERCADIQGVTVALNPDKARETIAVKVLHSDANVVSTVYNLHFVKKQPVAITFAVTPSDANVFLVNNDTGSCVYTDDTGTAMLPPGASFRYTVTRNGYAGVQEMSYTVPDTAETVTVTLEKAPERSYEPMAEVWPSFRADEYNNGVVNAKTPTTAEDAVLYWATQLGENYSADACGCPILVGDHLYTYAKDIIYKLNVVTGEIEGKGKMDHRSSFAINSPTYAEGMLFVGLSDGGVQAFDADTLESLWIYRDSLGGQPNCPIYYHNGYIYTGFWQGEKENANFVCLSVTDEDPTRGDEEKLPTWQYRSLGGFYWAGAYVADNYVLIPTDDGDSGYTSGYASILSLNPRTGELISSIRLPHPGDARSSVTYDNGRAYFTTKGGYFYSAAVSENGELSDLRHIKLYNYANDAKNPAMSTCTPVIYNGRAYIGISGVGQFKAYSGHNITVIDLNSWKIAYTVRTQGYPQTSGLLTTAYNEGDGTVYVYFFDNYTPGKLRVLRDKPGQTRADITVTETAIEGGKEISYETAGVLFTPDGNQAQYAICSPITDASGTIYFKNDSAYMMALGSVITELRVDGQPDKLAYRAGETFDPAGMKITAVYKNGFERDVTQYVTFSQQPLGSTDSAFEIRFEHVMYQDKDGQGGSKYPVDPPSVTIALTIAPSIPGDVDADGNITAEDAAKVAEHVRNTESKNAGGFTLTETEIKYADVNGDGKVTMEDAELIWQYSRGEITEFPKKETTETTKTE